MLGVAAFVALRPKTTPPVFTTAPLARGDVIETIEATGAVQPLLQVQVGAQVSGRVAKVHVEANDVVEAGRLLAEMESAPFEAQAAQVRAALASAEAQLGKARVDLSTQNKNLERARALAEKGLSARADLDTAEGARDVAAAQVQVAQAQVAQAQANVAASKENLAYTKITAPIAGTVISRPADDARNRLPKRLRPLRRNSLRDSARGPLARFVVSTPVG